MRLCDEQTIVPRSNVSEQLERRILLAGATLDSAGALTVIGTSKSDTIFILFDQATRLSVRINKQVTRFAVADIRSMSVQAGPANDIIVFQGFAQDPARFTIPVTLFGSGGNDLIKGPASRARIFGGTGNDTVQGGRRRDIIYGGEGDDVIDGGNGNDFLRGGDGNDRIVGGLGIDECYGDGGKDTIVTRADIYFRSDTRPFLTPESFDLVDGGGGHDRADADAIDRKISIESTFQESF